MRKLPHTNMLDDEIFKYSIRLRRLVNHYRFMVTIPLFKRFPELNSLKSRLVGK